METHRVSRYELLLFLHIAGATIWLGAALTVQLLVLRAERTADPAALRSITEGSEWLATRVFIPASLSVLLLGVLLVLDGPWSFGDLWIVLGLAGYAASFLVGILYFKPEGDRLAKELAQRGRDEPDLAARIRRMNAVSWLELVVLFLVVADMSLKPTGDDVGTLVAGAVVLVAAGALTARSFGRLGPSRAQA